MISTNSIDNLMQQVHVEEVVGDFVTLKRRGINLIGLCPFHNERTPSFTVSPAKGLFKCFGCGKGGSAITFLMELEHFTYPEAIRHLARRYNFELQETQDGQAETESRLEKESLMVVTHFAMDHFIHNLHDTMEGQSIGLSYFEERGFKPDIIEKFQLGYAIDNRDDLTSIAIKKGYNLENLKKAGVTTESGKDFLFGRVVFPIHNLAGKTIAFAGRVLKKDSQPKYLNSPETEIYNKSKTLYGIYLARTAIRKYDACYLVEGYTDVISMHQAGIENVVASSGTALTSEHLKLLKRFTNNIILLYDGDAAGVKATLRGMELALEQDMDVRIVTLPFEDDPDSFVKRERFDGFNNFVETHGENFLYYKARTLLPPGIDDPIKKITAVKGLAESLALMPDPLKRSIYIKDCAKMMGVDEGLLAREVSTLINKKLTDTFKREQAQQAQDEIEGLKEEIDTGEIDSPTEMVNAADELREYEIIKILIEYGHKPYTDKEKVRDILLAGLAENHPDSPLFARIVDEYNSRLQEGESVDYHHFLNNPDIEIQKMISDMVTPRYVLNSNWHKEGIYVPVPEESYVETAARSLLYYKLSKMVRMRKSLMEALKNAQNADEERELLMLIKQADKLVLNLRLEQGNVITQYYPRLQ